MEKQVTIPCGSISLDGLFNKNRSKNAVVITHPHPLYGGNMDNPVVLTLAQSFFEAGFSTLRFDFRGTRHSTGMFDNGNGEQDDVRSAMSFLKDQGFDQIFLSGYSFGARINVGVISAGADIVDNVMVSPPVSFMSFDDVENLPVTGLIVTGSNDEIAPAAMVESHVKRWDITPRFEIIDNCDHFYSQGLYELKKILLDYLNR